jgi:CAAX protease family protein
MSNLIDTPPMPAERGAALRPWGFWATLGWTLLAPAVALLLIIALGRILSLWDMDQLLSRAMARGGDPASSLMNMLMFGIAIAVLAVAARCAGWRATEYFALVRPHGRYVLFGFLCTALPLLLTFAHAMNFDLNGFFNSHGYDHARAANGLVLHYIAVAIAAPVTEEIIFRGFLYRGLAASRIGVVGAIVITSVAWALAHPGQGTAGMIDTAVVGLAWGWLRWYTGSISATIAWHVANNAVMSLLPIAAVYGWFS